MKVRQILDALEQFAPLPLQESYDNAGLQIGLTEVEEVTGALLCLDVTEEIIDEAAANDCNIIIAHHPLLFHRLRSITGQSYVERCVVKAIRLGISIYAAHTNLDNALGGVNYKIAQRLGLQQVTLLDERPDHQGGSGILGLLPQPEEPVAFMQRLKELFGIQCLAHNAFSRHIYKVAVCGGAGSFLLSQAIASGADAFLTGEMGYHDYFGHEDDLLIAAMGHYESEQYTIDLFQDILQTQCPGLRLYKTKINTNPIKYL